LSIIHQAYHGDVAVEFWLASTGMRPMPRVNACLWMLLWQLYGKDITDRILAIPLSVATLLAVFLAIQQQTCDICTSTHYVIYIY